MTRVGGAPWPAPVKAVAGYSGPASPIISIQCSTAAISRPFSICLRIISRKIPTGRFATGRTSPGKTPLQALGVTSEDTPCSQVVVPPCLETFLEARPKYLKRNLHHCKKKAAALGALEFAVSENPDSPLLTDPIDLHGARWREAGEAGMIAANASANFLREVATTLAKRDMLRIFTARLDCRVVAIVLALRNETTIFCYLTAFDPIYKKYEFGSELLSD